MEAHLQGAAADDSFRALAAIVGENSWSKLMRKHNDPDDSFHVMLFEFVQPALNSVQLVALYTSMFSLLWVLLNTLGSI